MYLQPTQVPQMFNEMTGHTHLGSSTKRVNYESTLEREHELDNGDAQK